MSGTLNQDNKELIFTDNNYNLKIGKIDRFIMIVDIEELDFGNSTPRADLMLLYRNERDILEIVLFELKNVKKTLSSRKIEELLKRIFSKYHSSMSLFGEQKANLNPGNKSTKLEGIFSNVIKSSKYKKKTFYFVIPDEFKSQVVPIMSKIKEKNSKEFEINYLTESEVFTP